MKEAQADETNSGDGVRIEGCAEYVDPLIWQYKDTAHFVDIEIQI